MNQESPNSKKPLAAEIYKNLLELVPAVVYIADIGAFGEWFYVSPQIKELLGYAPDEWMAEPDMWIKHVHPEDRQHVLTAEADSRQSGSFSGEYRMLTRDGRVIWVRDEGRIAKAESRYYAFLFDITKEKAAADRAEEKQKKVEAERLQLEQRLRSLHKFEAIGRLAGGIAHDFNNLLMSITSYCELLRIKIGDPGMQELQEIQKATVQGSALIRHLLAFGGKQIHAPRKLDLNHVLKSLKPIITRLLGEDVNVEMILAGDLGVVDADLSQMEDMIVNLTMVSRDSMPQGGTLRFGTANVEMDHTDAIAHSNMQPGKYVQLSVSDTGAGLDEEARTHIFEPFYTRKDHTMGGGLRLPAVYGIVKQNGGNIWVYGELGHGTTFKIYLPRIDAAVETLIQPEEQPVAIAVGKTILVVDDNDSVRTAIIAYLKMNGLHVLEASNGKDAIQLADSNAKEIDLLITDLVMPQMGGLELSRHLGIRNTNLRVLYMSGYTEESIIRQGMLEPGAFFLQKPASMQVLLKKVHELLNS